MKYNMVTVKVAPLTTLIVLVLCVIKNKGEKHLG